MVKEYSSRLIGIILLFVDYNLYLHVHKIVLKISFLHTVRWKKGNKNSLVQKISAWIVKYGYYFKNKKMILVLFIHGFFF